MKSTSSPGSDVSCRPPDTGGGGGGGGGDNGSGGGSSGGGGGTTTPAGTGKKVSTLAKRSLRLSARKKKVKAGSPLKLIGKLHAPKKKKRRSCQIKQKVAIQRFQGTFWVTVDVAVTARSGSFSATVIPAPAGKFVYRAHVNQTKRCAGGNSKRVKVTAAA
jgi:hypothetical protein